MRMSSHRSFPRWMGLVAPLGAALTVAACGSSGSADSAGTATVAKTKTVELAYFLPIANSFMAPATQGIKDAAAKLNAKVRIYDANFDPSKQFNQMQDALTSSTKWGGWIVSPVDGSTVAPGVKDASGQGIPVSCLISTCGPDSVDPMPQSGEKSFSGPNAKLLGNHLGDLTVEACGDISPCNAFLLTIDPKFSVDRAMATQMQAVIKSHPQIKLVSSTKGGAVDPEVARTTTQDYLQGHKGVSVIVSTADQMTRGVELAVKDAGLSSKVKIISLGASKQAVAAVAAGRWYADVVRVPYDEGYSSAVEAIKAARGEAVAPSVTTDKLTKVQILKKDNASAFKGQWDS